MAENIIILWLHIQYMLEKDKGFYSTRRDHEYGKPLINKPTIGNRTVTIEEYRDFISRDRLK